MRVTDWVAQQLIELGVKRVYGLPGGFVQVLNDAITHSDLQMVYFLHESGAAFAACGEARYTGQLAVVCVTSGPGSTNTLTAIASAFDDSVPLLVLAGEVETRHVDMRESWNLREGGPQDVDFIHMVKPIVKDADIILDPRWAKSMFAGLVKVAMEYRRGPVVLVIPLDVQKAEI